MYIHGSVFIIILYRPLNTSSFYLFLEVVLMHVRDGVNLNSCIPPPPLRACACICSGRRVCVCCPSSNNHHVSKTPISARSPGTRPPPPTSGPGTPPTLLAKTHVIRFSHTPKLYTVKIKHRMQISCPDVTGVKGNYGSYAALRKRRFPRPSAARIS